MKEPKLLLESAKWLVFSKPAGWLTIPGRDPAGTPVLSEWAKERHGEVWTVHRLDRETSGAILFARTAESHREANTWFQSHRVKKIYHCLAAGRAEQPVFRIQKAVEGAPSTTQVEVKENSGAGFLAHVRPVTGRRHQIRIHLASTGHALWGDPQYGGPREVQLRSGTITVVRVALHAAILELPSGEKIDAPWPEDFAGWVEALRKEAANG